MGNIQYSSASKIIKTIDHDIDNIIETILILVIDNKQSVLQILKNLQMYKKLKNQTI
jgi:hypothetical protein